MVMAGLLAGSSGASCCQSKIVRRFRLFQQRNLTKDHQAPNASAQWDSRGTTDGIPDTQNARLSLLSPDLAQNYSSFPVLLIIG
jgi:hypothetical protein